MFVSVLSVYSQLTNWCHVLLFMGLFCFLLCTSKILSKLIWLNDVDHSLNHLYVGGLA